MNREVSLELLRIIADLNFMASLREAMCSTADSVLEGVRVRTLSLFFETVIGDADPFYFGHSRVRDVFPGDNMEELLDEIEYAFKEGGAVG